jgi:hypothetical protein
MNMAFNADLGSSSHSTFLAIPRRRVQPLGVVPAHFSMFETSGKPEVAEQLFVWCLDGYDVGFTGVTANGVTLDFDQVPDLLKLHPDSSFDRSLLGPNPPANGPISARFCFKSGSFRSVQVVTDKLVSFEPLITKKPKGPFSSKLPDIATVDLDGDAGAFAIKLRKRSDGASGSIVVVPGDDERDVVTISVSNVCGRANSDDDREFAAYYDTLADPKQCLERRVPFVEVRETMGARTDCTGIAQAAYEE